MSFLKKQSEIVFFSGTGGTRRIACAFQEELIKRGMSVRLIELGQGKMEQTFTEAEFYLLLFPVYAFDAPELIYRWIETLDGDPSGQKAAVISVSGGGEVWPNTGCRTGCCKALERKGVDVVYESMMCMPANLAVEINDDLSMWMIREIPKRVNQIITDLQEGVEKRARSRKGPVCSYLTKLERRKGYLFAKSLRITEECRSCGWCASHCPVSNIQMSKESTKPVFLDHCIVCVRCVYGCPFHAIQCDSSVIFRNGFDLDKVERRMEGKDLMPVQKCCKGLLLVGVKKYLLEKNS